LIATLTAIVGLSAALETIAPRLRDPEFGYRIDLLEAQQRRAPGKPLILVLGTSRTQNAIHPAAMGFPDEEGWPGAFNFGQSGARSLRVLLTLQRVLDRGFVPAAVVVEVLPPWLEHHDSAEEQFAEKATQLTRADLRRLEPYCDDPRLIERRWLAARLAPWWEDRTVIVNHLDPESLPWKTRIDFHWNRLEADGWLPLPFPSARPDVLDAARHEYRHGIHGIHPHERSLRPLRGLAAICRERAIPLAFFVPPVSPAFRSWYDAGVLEAAEQQLRSFATERGATVFGAPSGLAEADFLDGHHLLREAAHRYSRWLAVTHLAPWLAGKGIGYPLPPLEPLIER
jgi:hypothetical protein